jgi:CRP-like cAMP-binding protein
LRSRRRQASWPYTLSNLALFAECTPAELEAFVNLFTCVRLRPGTVLMREERRGREFMVIEDGFVIVTQGRDSDTRVLSVLGPGDFVGEMALLDRTLRTATVTTITPVTLYVSTPSEFLGVLAHSPSVEEKVTRADLERGAENLLAAA